MAALRAALPGVPLLAGGPSVTGEPAARELAADGWGADADDVAARLAELVYAGGGTLPPRGGHRS
jgi:hypothetical protein